MKDGNFFPNFKTGMLGDLYYKYNFIVFIMPALYGYYQKLCLSKKAHY